MKKDMKDRIAEIAEDLADKRFGKGFYDLTEAEQTKVYADAESDYADEVADECDRLAEQAKMP